MEYFGRARHTVEIKQEVYPPKGDDLIPSSAAVKLELYIMDVLTHQSVAQSSLDVEFILRTVENLCLKLIELGHEYFLVTANPSQRDSSKQIGSNQGREFLHQHSEFIYKFMNHCYESHCKTDHKKSALLKKIAENVPTPFHSETDMNSLVCFQNRQQAVVDEDSEYVRKEDNSTSLRQSGLNCFQISKEDASVTGELPHSQRNDSTRDESHTQEDIGAAAPTSSQRNTSHNSVNMATGMVNSDSNDFDSDNDELSEIVGMIVQDTVTSLDQDFKDMASQKSVSHKSVSEDSPRYSILEENSQETRKEENGNGQKSIEHRDKLEEEENSVDTEGSYDEEQRSASTLDKGGNSPFCDSKANMTTRSRDSKHDDDQSMINTPEDTYECDLCGKVCMKKDNLMCTEQSRCAGRGQQSIGHACLVCKRKFQNLFNLQRHEKRHSSERNFVCGTCGKKFYRSDALKIHATSHSRFLGDPVQADVKTRKNMTEKAFYCSTCGETFSCKRSLLRHTNRHTGVVKYTCELCNKTFSRQDVYSKHVKGHKSASVECEVCHKTFTSQQKLSQHMVKRHDDSKNACECQHCGQRYKWQYLLNFHDCSKSYKENMTLYYRNIKNEGIESPVTESLLKCPMCQKVFKKRRGLISHLKTHQAMTKYKCPICSQLFKQRCNLNKHLRFVHSSEKNFVCDICGKSFKQGDTLKQHRKLHTDGPPTQYQCETCGKYLSGSSALEIHMRSHSGAKPFMCEICGRSFRQSGNMQKHMLVHTDKTTYKCEICHKEYKYQETWKAHMRSHVLREGKAEGNASAYGKFYTCQFCDKKMSSASQYKVHLRTHTNERPYKCNICEKAFKEHGKLSRHLKIHDSEFHVNPKRMKTDKKTLEPDPKPEAQLMPLTSVQPVDATAHQYMELQPHPGQIPHLSGHMGPHPVLLLASEYHQQQQQQQQQLQPHHSSPHPPDEIVPLSSHDQFYRDIKSMMFPNTSL